MQSYYYRLSYIRSTRNTWGGRAALNASARPRGQKHTSSALAGAGTGTCSTSGRMRSTPRVPTAARAWVQGRAHSAPQACVQRSMSAHAQRPCRHACSSPPARSQRTMSSRVALCKHARSVFTSTGVGIWHSYFSRLFYFFFRAYKNLLNQEVQSCKVLTQSWEDQRLKRKCQKDWS